MPIQDVRFVRALICLVSLPILCAALALPAEAADKPAKVDGVVVDKDGKPLQGIEIRLRLADGTVVATATSNKKGKFSFSGLDASQQHYLRLENAEYGPFEDPIRLEAGTTLEARYPLLSREEMTRQREELAAIEAHNKAARLYNAGADLYNQEKLDEALQSFIQATEENPELAIAWAGIGKVHLDAERYEEALPALNRLVELAPDEKIGHLMLFDTHESLGNQEAADATLATLAEKHPGTETAKRLFNRAVAAVKGDRLEEALEGFQQVATMEPGLYQAHLNSAHIHRAFQDWEQTLAEVDLFLAREPGQARALALRYQALKELDRPEAAEALAKLKETSPAGAAEIFYDEGLRLFNAGESQAALPLFQNVLDIAPDHGQGHYMSGLCHASLGDTEKAKEFLRRFLELAPDAPDAELARQMLASL